MVNVIVVTFVDSGGRMIQVFGMNFHSIQQPIMHLHHSSGNKSSPVFPSFLKIKPLFIGSYL